MNKQERIIVVLLILSLFGWMYIKAPHGGKQLVSPSAQAPVPETAGITNSVPVVEELRNMNNDVAVKPGDNEKSGNSQPLIPEQAVKKPLLPEERVVLSDDRMAVTVSSWGGAIVAVELKQYKESLAPDSKAVSLDFSSHPALAYTGLPEFSKDDDFDLSVDEAGKTIRVERTATNGLRMLRTIALGEDYKLSVTDVLSNAAGSDIDVTARYVGVGPMPSIRTKADGKQGISYLDIDTLPSVGSKDLVHWAKKGGADEKADSGPGLAQLFQPEGRRGGGCMGKAKLVKPLPETITTRNNSDIDWLAVKNKFFVQIITPENGGNGCELIARREIAAGEQAENSRTWAQMAVLNEVAGSVCLKGFSLKPGESSTDSMSYYVGPKKFSVLSKLGRRQNEVMFYAWPGCGWFIWLCEKLLWTLNFIHAYIPNYGVAIILLTIIVKVIFWPVTHKSTESMKKMQKIQPLVNELREKYKDNPQKLQKATMELYKEHKVNPMMGCLPTLIQIPVFIALFVVLRSAVELRFADFLWVRDLSEPEGLLKGVLPWALTLNILPILMTATMVLQQRLTPSAGDPQQQKIMAYMPVIFMFMLYNMASGLMLYWTVSQTLSIVQLWMHRQKAAHEAVA